MDPALALELGVAAADLATPEFAVGEGISDGKPGKLGRAGKLGSVGTLRSGPPAVPEGDMLGTFLDGLGLAFDAANPPGEAV